MKTPLIVDTCFQELHYKGGLLILSNKDGSPLRLPQSYTETIIDPKDTEIISGLKKSIEKKCFKNQMQVIASTACDLNVGNQTVCRVLKKYENVLWSHHKGEGKQARAYEYFLIQ